MDVKKKLIEAIQLNQAGKYQDAESIIKEILIKDNRNVDALRILGEIFLNQDNYSNAIHYFEKSLQIFDKQPILLNNCGFCLLHEGDLEKASLHFDKAIKLNPNFEDALFNKALIFEKKGDFVEAINTHKRIINLNSAYLDSFHKLTSLFFLSENYESALNNLNEFKDLNPNKCDAIFYQERSLAFLNLKKVYEALYDINKSIEIDPNLSQSYNNRGNILKELGKKDEALQDFQKAIYLNQNSIETLSNIANLYNEIGKFELALENYNKAISLDPNNCNLYVNRAQFFRGAKNFDKALEDANQAIMLGNSCENFKSRADIYVAFGDYELALLDINKAINLKPLKKSYYNDRASLLIGMERYREAENDYIKKINSDDKLSEIQKFNLSLLYLSEGNFQDGWENYRFRKIRTDYKEMNFSSSKPEWRGEKGVGIIYIYNEQGIGDQILFSSLVPEVLKTNNKIILSIDPRMLNTYLRSFQSEDIEILPKLILDHKNFVDSSKYDFHISICDLGGLFRKNIDSFKIQPHNFLKSDSSKKIFSKTKKVLCGIAWQSKGPIGDHKSINLEDFLPILKIEEIEYINLQYGNIKNDIEATNSKNNVMINYLNEFDYFNDIDGLFSLIEACDFIITTSNLTAHMAGALGKKTYLLSPKGVGKIWYWRLYNGRNLWYPSVEVVEQTDLKNWTTPINQLANIIKRDYL